MKPMVKTKTPKHPWWATAIPLAAIAIFVLYVLPKINSSPSEPYSTENQISRPTDKKVTPEEATAKVKTLPEVKAYLKRVPGGLVAVGGEDDSSYLVQVYEFKDNHTTTFNWYYVDKGTGAVEPQF